jgi:hypothetical protein
VSSESETDRTEQLVKRRPPNAGKGRRPGSRNKWGQDVQRTILTALDQVGGVRYLKQMAYEQPVAFMGLVGKCVPRELRADITAELTIKQEIRRDLVDSLVDLMGKRATQVIDVTPQRLSAEPREPIEAPEAKERIPGSELNAELEQRESEQGERVARDGVRERLTDAAITRVSVEANQGGTYLSERTPAQARGS